MAKAMRCPNCGCRFEKELKDKGYTYSDVKSRIEELLDERQTINSELISSQYGRPRLEVSEMMTKIRKKKTNEILRATEQGQFKFLSEPEEIAPIIYKRWRGIRGQLKIHTRDTAKQVSLLEKSKEPENLQKATEIRGTFHIIGGLLPEPIKARRLPDGLFECVGDVDLG